MAVNTVLINRNNCCEQFARLKRWQTLNTLIYQELRTINLTFTRQAICLNQSKCECIARKNLTALVWNSYISVLKKHLTNLKANKLLENLLISQIVCPTGQEQDTSQETR
ncbi:uncharacterized protein [Linepithema humile]|uniref:uncharacterized protein isoform X1 n=1 Tax=Linepithema humile TaxID=83485 RepID=UPI00062364CB|nr:PREDICTED: uncharacterized protein LOC105678480 isoform X1 [Linepithema humile]